MANDETGQDLGDLILWSRGNHRQPVLSSTAWRRRQNASRSQGVGLAKLGRVLVLLDACHSGAVTDDGSTLTSNADLLRSIATGNVTVLTSSTANEFFREDEKWSNGAFSKVLLDALGKDADEDHDGLISHERIDALCD